MSKRAILYELSTENIAWLQQNVPDIVATTIEGTAEEGELKSDGHTSTNEVNKKVMVKPKLTKEQPGVEKVAIKQPNEDDEKIVDSFFVTSTSDNFFSKTILKISH